MSFDAFADRVLGHEGGYSNNPVDPGAETMFGVSARVARANGYKGDMRMLTREQALAIYRRAYWSPIRGDDLPPVLAFQAFDAAINSGTHQAAKWLQRAVGVADDGAIGPLTMTAVARANPVLAAVLIPAYRLDLMTSLPTFGAFGKGWSRRIGVDLQYLVSDA